MDKLEDVQLEKIEEQIENEQRSVKYDIREFTIEYYVDKYSKGVDRDKNELYVPEYQRNSLGQILVSPDLSKVYFSDFLCHWFL